MKGREEESEERALNGRRGAANSRKDRKPNRAAAEGVFARQASMLGALGRGRSKWNALMVCRSLDANDEIWEEI